MKKLVVTILSLVYLSATVGITLQQHYCMDRFVGWSLMDTGGDLCGSCGMDKSEPENGCCKDEQLQLKIGDDQQPSFITVQFHQPELPVLPFTCLYQHPVNMPAGNKFVTDHGPPHAAAIPVFLLNRVFRI